MDYIDFDNNKNSFKDTECVSSVLLYGNPECSKGEKITICIPTYKRADFIREAIESSLNQKNYTIPYKVLVIDNNDDFSNNEILSIVKSYNSPLVCYYKNEKNIQMFGNMNRCFAIAKTPWVAILHDDDLLSENYIQIVEELISRKKDADCICMPIENIGCYPGKPVQQPRNLKQKIINMIRLSLYQDKFVRFSTTVNIFSKNIFGAPTCGILFRRSAVLESGGFDQDFFPSADWYFMVFFNRKYHVYRYNRIIAKYRWSDNCSLKPETKEKFKIQKKQALDSLRKEFCWCRIVSAPIYKELTRLIDDDNPYSKTSKVYNMIKKWYTFKYL